MKRAVFERTNKQIEQTEQKSYPINILNTITRAGDIKLYLFEIEKTMKIKEEEKKVQWQQPVKCHDTCAYIIRRFTTAPSQKKENFLVTNFYFINSTHWNI